MEFLENHPFGQAWRMYNGHYLITFPDHSIEEFESKRDYQAYVRRMKRHMGIVDNDDIPGMRRLRRLDDKEI